MSESLRDEYHYVAVAKATLRKPMKSGDSIARQIGDQLADRLADELVSMLAEVMPAAIE